jgi:FkbM family methyltransferase
MLLRNLLPLVKNVERVIDASAGKQDLRRHLMVPDDLPFSAATTEWRGDGAGTLVLCMLGPEAGSHTPPAELARKLSALPVGVTVLILAGWPAETLPVHVVLQTLADGHCQLTDAVSLSSTERYGMHVALLAERVETVQPRAARLSGVLPGEPAPWPDARLPAQLWVLNQPVLGELAVAPLREQVRTLEERITQLSEELTAARAETDEARTAVQARTRQLAKSRKARAALEASASFRLGKSLVDGVRHPGKGMVAVPRTVADIWRARRARAGKVPDPLPASTPAPAPVVVRDTHRVVSIPVPGTPGRAMTMTAPVELLVPRKLAQSGLAAYESSSIPCFLAAIETTATATSIRAAGPGAVFDIGANVGLYAALAAAVSDRDVVAFEPFPTLAEVAERVAADNDLKIRVERIALSDHSGTATFYLSDSSDSSNSLAAGFRKSSRQIEVAVETLDEYVTRTGTIPAVLKVDTETTEPDVLLGAAETLRKYRPWVLCEVLRGRGEDRLMEALAPHGYHWYHIVDEVPYREAQTVEGDPTYQDLMWLFAPEPPDESFWSAVRAQRAAVEAAGELRPAPSR